ncbi:MAG: hypothetical protein EOO30_20190 [Comamonadaceae bacterium]|nr:MAG: hypothetical protein EOO30_20190 [Comamonadaceae bacterium]
MKLDVVTKTLAAAAAALLVAGCGGGGGDAALNVSGTAATGAALANADVRVKCAEGDGTATTNASGGYTVSVGNGKLPCLVQVSGTTAAGASVTLHSIADTADANGEATANVTPVTEMIVAYLLAAIPSQAFDAFDPQQVTPAAVTQAATAIVTALKDAGVDLTGIDPLKADLVPAVNGSGGNAYDQLLDNLGKTVGPESLPLVVNQIATAAAAGGSAAGLTTAMAAVAGGSLEGCPVALSGKYRAIDYNGALQNITLDFKAMTIAVEGESGTLPVTRSSTQACEVKVDTSTIVFGPGGVGAIHAADVIGYLVPVQPHTLASIAGAWTFLESGLDENNLIMHFMGKFTIAADGKTSLCEYDLANFSTCTPDVDESVQALADGGFKVVNDDNMDTRFYGFRAPNGEITLFGTNNPSNSWALGDYKTHWVMTKAPKAAVPDVGHVQKFWQLRVSAFNGSDLVTAPLVSDSSTITASDAAAGTFTRQQASNGQVDSWQVNHPVDGMRHRAGAGSVSEMHQLLLPGLGMSAFLVGSSAKSYGILVTQP